MPRTIVYRAGEFTNCGIGYTKFSQEELAEMKNRATENEVKAVKFIKNIKDDAIVTLDHIAKEEPQVIPFLYKSRKEKADTILAMVEELQKYRELGTVEELNAKNEELKRWHTDKIVPNVKNPFAYTSTLCCCNCDHKDDYIEELETEVEEYREIGTAEECREAVEKQIPYKPRKERLIMGVGRCKCGVEFLDKGTNFCGNCGQKLDWDRRANDGETD